MSPVLSDPGAVREQVRAWRRQGERIALVPTMGDLHAGHLALVDHACAVADRTVVSLFVNPLQFGPGEDYAAYPRVPEQDRARLAEHGVDAVFAPSDEALYPFGLDSALRISVPGLDDILCGVDRPGHFSGVATVVTKLFNTVDPDVAVFGEKDYQQLLLVRRLVAELLFAIDIHGVATVREADGLALSSRNSYLDEEQRRRAPTLFAVLQETASAVGAGARDFAALTAHAEQRLRANGLRPEYVEIRRAADLARPRPADSAAELRVLAAGRLGRARLIDNVAVTLGEAK